VMTLIFSKATFIVKTKATFRSGFFYGFWFFGVVSSLNRLVKGEHDNFTFFLGYLS
jgi:hypothetical protein